jgi:hypothetical protein
MQQGSVMKLYRLSQSEFRSWRDREAREELKNRVFALHGDTQLRAPSGRILGTARAPEKSARVPIEKSVARGAHHAVSPRECICREWQKPAGKQDEHHPICVHKQPWEGQQKHDPDAPRARAVVKAPRTTAPVEAAAEVPPVPAVPLAQPPAGCVCQQWAGAVEGKHHPLCAFRKAWEAQQGEVAPQLVELETGTVIREANADEVAASKQKAGDDGVGAIELSDGKLYYVKEA